MKHGAILIDPPVSYESWSKPANARNAIAKYSLMTWDDLAALGPLIDAVALPDACLFLWICPPLIPQTLRMAEAWGWQYSTVAFTWVKTTNDRLGMKIGLGYWTRANAEQVWLFRRGKPARRSRGVLQAIHSHLDHVGESPAVVTHPGPHSAKPEEAHNRIERLVDGPYLEMFARRRRDGWTTVGNGLDGLDIRESLRLVANDEPLPSVTTTLLELV